MSRFATSCLVAALVMVPCGSVEAQSSMVLIVRAEQWSAPSSPVGDTEGRTGLVVGIGSTNGAAAGRLLLGWVPGGDDKAGWTTLLVEAGPGVTLGERLELSAQFLAGGLTMRPRNGVGCPPDLVGCFAETPSFEEGWGFMGGFGGTAGLVAGSRLDVTVHYAHSWILGGANAEETLGRWGLGVEYRLR